MMTVGSLFSGIGGIDLGLERAGMLIRWQVEIDPFCNRVLAKHWPAVKRYGDIRELAGQELEPVDLVCGGFPCQDVSTAAYHPEGFTGSRTGLFWELARLVRMLRPKYVLMENVPGIIDNGFPEILGELASIGYDAEWEMFQANWFLLPHIRKRLFIVAYPMCLGRRVFEPVYQRFAQDAESRFEDQNILPVCFDGNTPEALADDLREDNGLSRMVDQNRIRVLGNAVTPPIAEYIGRLILESEK